MQAYLGIFVFYLVAWLFSEQRWKLNLKFLLIGLLLQFGLSALFLNVPLLVEALSSLDDGVVLLDSVSQKATAFLFGYLAGGKTPFAVTEPSANYIIAFRVLPLILVVSALSALLFHWRVLSGVIQVMAKAVSRFFRLSGPLAFGAASSLFFGTIEAPILIKPYLRSMSRAELLALFSCSLSTISGTVMVLYASVLGQVVSNAASHLLVASIISIPAALVLSNIVIPIEAKKSEIPKVKRAGSSMEALITGTLEGLQMVMQIVAILIVLFALVYLLNHVLSGFGGGTLQEWLAYLLRPLLWLTGISWEESFLAAELMGTKIILNEFVAYLELSKLQPNELSQRAQLILSYCLCGFANLGSVGIILGGVRSILPERSEEISSLVLKALLIGNLATLSTGAIVGILS